MNSECEDKSEAAFSPALPLAAFGESILRLFERDSDSESVSLITEGAALVAGLRSALCRVFLIFGLPAVCVFAALGYEQLVQWLGKKWDLSEAGHLTHTGLMFVVLLGGGGALWAAHQIYTDAEDKWRRLHWFYYGLFAAVLLNCYGPFVLLFAAGALHFVVHLAVHQAFQARDISDPGDLPDGKEVTPPKANSGL